MSYRRIVQTPIGLASLEAEDEGIVSFEFRDSWAQHPQDRHSLLDQAEAELEQYFAGKRMGFDVPLKIDGSEFQKEVWQQMCDIPYGSVMSYQEVAQAIGRPKAQRAVGMAAGANRIPIFIPCHRIVASQGKLGGFSCGIEKKIWLLDLEEPMVFAASADPLSRGAYEDLRIAY